MKIGSLYRVKECYWLLFPLKESARRGCGGSRDSLESVADDAAYYSKKYNENVIWFPPDSYIVLLDQDREFKKVLTSDGTIGWAWLLESWNNNFEEINQQ